MATVISVIATANGGPGKFHLSRFNWYKTRDKISKLTNYIKCREFMSLCYGIVK